MQPPFLNFSVNDIPQVATFEGIHSAAPAAARAGFLAFALLVITAEVVRGFPLPLIRNKPNRSHNGVHELGLNTSRHVGQLLLQVVV
jgi:hypothetical protein